MNKRRKVRNIPTPTRHGDWHLEDGTLVDKSEKKPAADRAPKAEALPVEGTDPITAAVRGSKK